MPGKLIGIAGTVADAIIAKVIADAVREALDWCFSDYEKLAKASQERRPHVEQGDVAMARVALATQPLGSSSPCARPSVSRDERSADKVKGLILQDEKAWVSTDVMLSLMEKLV